MGLNEGNVGRSVCPAFGKSTYGASLTKTSETVLEIAIGIDQIMMSPIELLKCCYQFGFLIPLAQNLCSEHFPMLNEVLKALSHAL